jgi:hypothetical protein
MSLSCEHDELHKNLKSYPKNLKRQFVTAAMIHGILVSFMLRAHQSIALYRVIVCKSEPSDFI